MIEVEEMISKVREMQGRPFDIRQLTTSCVANVILSMSFGRRFDHSDTAFRQLVLDMNEFTENFSQALEWNVSLIGTTYLLTTNTLSADRVQQLLFYGVYTIVGRD